MRKQIFALLILIQVSAVAQVDFSRQYNNARDLFKQGKYNLAMEAFKPLIAYDKDNKYTEYASFYYALAAYKQGYKAVAKDMLNQVRTTYPKWDKLDEVNFWIGIIHFENGDYFQALKILHNIKEKGFDKDIRNAKEKYLPKVTDIETLRMMHEEYPKDEVIAVTFAKGLSKNLSGEADKEELESLIEQFKLKRSTFLPETPKSYLKEKYSVAVMLPFMVNTLEPTASKKRNQIVLDFYEGMKLAVDTLNTSGAKIQLRAYDTEQGNLELVQQLLNTEELKNADLVVGPLFPDENKIAQEFSLANKVTIIHPFTNNSETIGDNPYALLFQPSAETLGRAAAEYVAPRVRRKNTMVFYGPAKKDSVMAANFVETATANGLTVVANQEFANKDSKKIHDILATPTEFDEFKYPTQFTLKKDSLGSIYVASDDPLIYAEVVGSVETRGDSILVVGSENWLEDTAINPEKYQKLGVALAAPNYADRNTDEYKAFFNHFIRAYGKTPSSVARMGYEFMMFFGKELKQNGVFFQDALSKEGNVDGYLTEGFNYEFGRNNQLVPFIGFKQGELILLKK